MDEQASPESPGRRSFLGILIGTGAAIVGAFPLVRALAKLPPSSVAATDESWQHVLDSEALKSGPLASIGKPKRILLKRLISDRWQMREEQVPIYVVRMGEPREAVVVFSGICPHAGCSVSFRSKEKHFHCPCHDGLFSTAGEVLDGPPPRALDPLPHRITPEGLEVRFVRFQLNTSTRTEI